MQSSSNLLNSITIVFFGYFLLLDRLTLQLLKSYIPFHLEVYLEYIILETINWIENDSNLICYWIIFITLMSLCVRNEYGYDIETLHYIMFSIAMGYFTYIHKEFYPRNTRFLAVKLIILCLFLTQLFWSLLMYLLPYNNWIVSLKSLKDTILFIWPDITSIKNFTQKNPFFSSFNLLLFSVWYYECFIRK